jgi:hypothetical protein
LFNDLGNFRRKFWLRNLKLLSDSQIVKSGLVAKGAALFESRFYATRLTQQLLGPLERDLSFGFDSLALEGMTRNQERVRQLFFAQLAVSEIETDQEARRLELGNLLWLGRRLGLSKESLIVACSFNWTDLKTIEIIDSLWNDFAPPENLAEREKAVAFNPSYTTDDLRHIRSGKGDPAAAIYLNGLDSKVEAERQATIRHVLEMADAQDKRSDIPRALVVRVDELDARDVHAIEEEWRQKLLSVVPDVDSAHERVLRLYFVVVKKDIITRDALERAMGQLIQGLNHHASGRVALAFYTATGAGLDRTLADILIWLLGDGKAFPFSPVFEESLKQDKVYASQA